MFGSVGYVHRKGWTVYLPNGTVYLPNGTVYLPDGTVYVFNLIAIGSVNPVHVSDGIVHWIISQ